MCKFELSQKDESYKANHRFWIYTFSSSKSPVGWFCESL